EIGSPSKHEETPASRGILGQLSKMEVASQDDPWSTISAPPISASSTQPRPDSLPLSGFPGGSLYETIASWTPSALPGAESAVGAINTDETPDSYWRPGTQLAEDIMPRNLPPWESGQSGIGFGGGGYGRGFSAGGGILTGSGGNAAGSATTQSG